jgi:glycosyltransferase involved in cell wall biosynthesis
MRLNQAVHHSRGKYFARIDGDDIAYPERLEKQLAFLERHPEIDLMGTRMLSFRDDGTVIGAYPFKLTHQEICRNPNSGFYLYHPTWMGRRQWFLKNPYRPDFKKTQDQELLLRTHTNSLFASIPEFLNAYRKPTLSLKTILISRLYFSKALFQNALRLKRGWLMTGIPVQAAKGLVDTFAVVSGLNYKILRHRALPVPPVELKRWQRVWAAVN